MTAAAPWKTLFIKHISLLGHATPRFTLATVSVSPTSKAITPRSRILLFRGFYGELEPTPYNKAPLNPKGYSSDLLTYTTDVRMHKVKQLEAEDAVECVFWMSVGDEDNPNKGFQWRIRGSSVILDRDGEKCKEYITRHLRGSGSNTGDEFDINKEATAHFGNVSPVIQKSFKQPMPGRPKEKGNPNPELGLNEPVDGLHDKVARENFRVAVIEPRRVELVDLTNSPAQKWVWVIPGSEEEADEDLGDCGEVVDGWRKVELYP